ncbi:hypothetical protein [Winogradskyella sp.]|uniref:hypothetical protein n=1 Tax=Winogradskyella sp. TaxID=1883156 RepID=UPI003F69DD5A
MYNKKSKISNVVWQDDDKTLMKIFFEGSSNAVLESINSISWLAKKAKKQFSVEDIDKSSEEYYKKVGEGTAHLKMFVENYREFMEWKEEKQNSTKRSSITDILNYILSISHNKDDFFKLKLQIFELDEIKESTDREWKAKLRKAQSSLELLALVYQELPDLGNEPT